MQENIVRTSSFDDKYIVVRKLLGSMNSDVFIVQKKDCSDKYVCKKISRRSFHKNEYLFPNEIHSERIVKILEVYKDKDSYRLIMEYFPDSIDMFEYFGSFNLKEQKLRSLAKEMALAIKCCHEKGIVHMDIKFENFVIINKNPIKLLLVDFGASYKKGEVLPKIVGTKNFSAPEIADLEFSDKSDVWSLGTSLYYYHTGDEYFKLNKHDPIVSRLQHKINQIKCSETFKDFLLNTIVQDPDKRYDIDQVLAHKWLVP